MDGKVLILSMLIIVSVYSDSSHTNFNGEYNKSCFCWMGDYFSIAFARCVYI
jgi:hypothetical protein